MKLHKKFEEYLKDGTIKKTSINKPKAKFLMGESETSFLGLQERVDTMGINEKNTNSIVKDCYDIIMGIIRSKLLLSEYKSSGYFSHEAEISYLKNLGFSDQEIIFMNTLRHFRNAAIYDGKILDKSYTQKVVEFTKKIYPKLKNLIKRV
mgnify:FL=1